MNKVIYIVCILGFGVGIGSMSAKTLFVEVGTDNSDQIAETLVWIIDEQFRGMTFNGGKVIPFKLFAYEPGFIHSYHSKIYNPEFFEKIVSYFPPKEAWEMLEGSPNNPSIDTHLYEVANCVVIPGTWQENVYDLCVDLIKKYPALLIPEFPAVYVPIEEDWFTKIKNSINSFWHYFME